MSKLTADNRCVECGKGVWERAGYWRDRALTAERLISEWLGTADAREKWRERVEKQIERVSAEGSQP